MTREEEIQEAIKDIHKSIDCNGLACWQCIELSIGKGISWADQHPRKGLWDAEKVCKWINDRIGIDQKIETNSDGEPLADSYIAYCIARQNAADTMIKDLRKAMED